MKCLVIVCMVLLPVEGLELRASGWRQRRNRASGVHVDRRTDGFPTVRLRCSHLLGLVSQLNGVATEQNVRRLVSGPLIVNPLRKEPRFQAIEWAPRFANRGPCIQPLLPSLTSRP